MKVTRRWILGVVGVAAVASGLVFCRQATAGTPVYVGNKVPPGQQVSMDDIDHSAWDRLLRKYVNSDGMVNYRGWKASRADQQLLDSYLASLSAANPRAAASKEGKLAFWINAYNATTVKGILREYPTSSIRNHTAKLVGYNIWKDLQLIVGQQPWSLEDIEHKILRKMGDPRIHFAIVCASVGCPRLLNEAYTREKVNTQLEENAKDFFRRQRNFRHRGQTFEMSSILDQTERLRRIARWLPTDAAKQAAMSGRVRVTYMDYDWSLNEQR